MGGGGGGGGEVQGKRIDMGVVNRFSMGRDSV